MSVDVATLIQQAADFVFGPWTRFLFLGTALFLTLRLRFVQVRPLRGRLLHHVAAFCRHQGRAASSPRSRPS